MPNRLPDPKWKSGPPEPTHSHSDHAILFEDYVYDFDGPSVKEAENTDGTILTTVIEAAGCRRDGCDAEITHSHCYTAESFSDRLQQALLYAIRRQYDFVDDSVSITDDIIAEYVAANNVIIDHDGEYPIIGILFDGDDSYNRPMKHSNSDDSNVLGYVYPTKTFTTNTADGQCYGQPDPPSHEPYGL